jgi:hypothetical protein
LNNPRRELSIEGIPENYQPGKTYPLTLRFSPPAESAGFELSVRFSEGDRAGAQAGRLSGAGDWVKIIIGRVDGSKISETSASNATQYAVQTAARNQAGWTVHWTAPDPAHGQVVFHVAANAGNGDDSPFGDFIYTTSAVCNPE